MPHSPKETFVPPFAAPERPGWCCLRCLTRRGINMSGLLSLSAGSGSRGLGLGGGCCGSGLGGGALRTLATSAGRTVGAVATRATARARRSSLLLGQLASGDVALVDPHLDADATEGGAGLVEAVVDLRTQGVQRAATLAVELGARHLGAAEATGDLDTDALGAGAGGGLHALAHRTTERHTSRELLGDALRDELAVDLGVLDLEDVELDLLAGELLELAADAVGLGATTTDDDAGTRGVDVDAEPVTGALDVDAGDAGAVHARGHELADRHVLLDVVAVALTLLGGVGEPTALVLRGDPETEACGVDLLAHQRLPPFVALAGLGATTTVMWLVRLLMRPARPWARGRNRFMVGPSSMNAEATTRSRSSNRSAVLSALTRAFAIADSSTLRIGSAAPWGARRRIDTASVAFLPRMRSMIRRAFCGVTRTWRATARASVVVVSVAISDDAPSCRPSRDP